MKIILSVIFIILYSFPAFSDPGKQPRLYPEEYYPAPPPIHFKETGAVCVRKGPSWDCKAGRPPSKTINQGSAGGGLFNPFLFNGNNRGRGHGKHKPQAPVKLRRIR